MSNKVINKEKRVSLFQEIGLDDTGIKKWHIEFEKP